jgi:hypothetical protein
MRTFKSKSVVLWDIVAAAKSVLLQDIAAAAPSKSKQNWCRSLEEVEDRAATGRHTSRVDEEHINVRASARKAIQVVKECAAEGLEWRHDVGSHGEAERLGSVSGRSEAEWLGGIDDRGEAK